LALLRRAPWASSLENHVRQKADFASSFNAIIPVQPFSQNIYISLFQKL